MQSPEDSYTSLLSLINDLVTSIPMPYQPPPAGNVVSENGFTQRNVEQSDKMEVTRVGKPWTVAEESSLLQSLMLDTPVGEIADNLHRKVGGINARRYVIAERLIAQGATLDQAADIVKYSRDAIQAHLDKIAKKETEVPPPPEPEPSGISMRLIHKIGTHIGLSMDHYVGKVHTWEDIDFLTFKDRNNPKTKSIYTLNLKTLRPTQSSPIQKQLNAELELALS